MRLNMGSREQPPASTRISIPHPGGMAENNPAFQRQDSAETKTIDKAGVCWNLCSRSVASVAQLAEQLTLNINSLFTTVYVCLEEAKTLGNPRFSLASLTPTSPQKMGRGIQTGY